MIDTHRSVPQLRVDALGLPPGTDPAQLHRRSTLAAALGSAAPAIFAVARTLIEQIAALTTMSPSAIRQTIAVDLMADQGAIA